jgi:nucleotide-binding universal stress UspA family protein
VLAHEVDIPPIRNAAADALIGISAMATEAERQSRDTAAELAAEAEYLARRMMLPATTTTLRTRPAELAEGLVETARLHDATLFVFDPESDTQRELAEGLLFGSGGPLLLCPADDKGGHLRSVVVAWDGSRAASRALRDAVPVLQKAQAVTIVTAHEDKPVAASQVYGIRSLLEHHEIASTYRALHLNGRPIGEALQADAVEAEAGLLVMGAYGHSRFREFVLGGATASVLRQGPMLPIFLSH